MYDSLLFPHCSTVGQVSHLPPDTHTASVWGPLSPHQNLLHTPWFGHPGCSGRVSAVEQENQCRGKIKGYHSSWPSKYLTRTVDVPGKSLPRDIHRPSVYLPAPQTCTRTHTRSPHTHGLTFKGQELHALKNHPCPGGPLLQASHFYLLTGSRLNRTAIQQPKELSRRAPAAAKEKTRYIWLREQKQGLFRVSSLNCPSSQTSGFQILEKCCWWHKAEAG